MVIVPEKIHIPSNWSNILQIKLFSILETIAAVE